MNCNDKTIQIQNRLNAGKNVKIVYDENLPWFWKIYLNKHSKHSNKSNKQLVDNI